MKAGRWFTGVGSVMLFVVGILHGLKFTQLEAMIQGSVVKPPLDGITRGCWLVFSTEMIGLAILAFLASRVPNGARFVLLCAAIMAANAVLLLEFVGVFAGVYVTALVMVLYFLGGFLQSRDAPPA